MIDLIGLIERNFGLASTLAFILTTFFGIAIKILCGTRKLIPIDCSCQDYDKNIGQALLMHTDNLSHNRFNAFIVTESIFLAALSTLIGNPSTMRLVALVAIVFTFVVWYSLARISRALSWSSKSHSNVDKTYMLYTTQGTGKRIGTSVWFFVVWVLPFFVMLIWWLVLLMPSKLRLLLI